MTKGMYIFCIVTIVFTIALGAIGIGCIIKGERVSKEDQKRIEWMANPANPTSPTHRVFHISR